MRLYLSLFTLMLEDSGISSPVICPGYAKPPKLYFLTPGFPSVLRGSHFALESPSPVDAKVS